MGGVFTLVLLLSLIVIISAVVAVLERIYGNFETWFND